MIKNACVGCGNAYEECACFQGGRVRAKAREILGEKKPDPVNAPAHYTRGGIEVIDAIEAWGLGFRLANVVKYVARAGHKLDRIEDLKKAAWYLEREIRLSESAQLRLAFEPTEDAGEREVCS